MPSRCPTSRSRCRARRSTATTRATPPCCSPSDCGESPREIAEDLCARLGDAGGLVSSLDVAGPGFVNLKLAESGWQDLLHAIIEAGERYGQSETAEVAAARDAEGGRDAKPRVQVEFVSANPTGPLSTGHGRQAILGDCIARLLEATGLGRHARVLLQRRRPSDARPRRVREGALPRAARPRRRAACVRARRSREGLGRRGRGAPRRVPRGRLPGRLHLRHRGRAARGGGRRAGRRARRGPFPRRRPSA